MTRVFLTVDSLEVPAVPAPGSESSPAEPPADPLQPSVSLQTHMDSISTGRGSRKENGWETPNILPSPLTLGRRWLTEASATACPLNPHFFCPHLLSWHPGKFWYPPSSGVARRGLPVSAEESGNRFSSKRRAGQASRIYFINPQNTVCCRGAAGTRLSWRQILFGTIYRTQAQQPEPGFTFSYICCCTPIASLAPLPSIHPPPTWLHFLWRLPFVSEAQTSGAADQRHDERRRDEEEVGAGRLLSAHSTQHSTQCGRSRSGEEGTGQTREGWEWDTSMDIRSGRRRSFRQLYLSINKIWFKL